MAETCNVFENFKYYARERNLLKDLLIFRKTENQNI